ncbi:reverse transcriptase, putative [Talaromyces stipitatus ATCC 10500]|uniref:Reverse transcriptase, putative n=1 Tax=Talaromyces stipitatus (strain ATCC 10500 / CBS 375.48 / QM 6759 / NRRL 1006) TaxID=441959 RepID=B8LV23_TALSN|nr:reverse transcriptase, putative [Talaromyces stipitatus ATCC 10500]EED22644.1 reverse transcriptase, putative [Talaromyces stipitatus ATCC 10500]
MKRRTNELARDLHRQRIEQATESIDGFWRIARWVRNRGKPRATFTPTLHYNNTSYTAPKEKAALFREVLHPEPPEADLSDIGPQYRYPKPYTMPPITLDEPNKAPGPDGIPNLVLQRLLPTIEAYLVNLFNTCLRQQYCPDHFRKSTIVILRKPGKPDYSDLKAYCPIALLSTIGKALESVLARRLSYLVEQYNLLLKQHIGGRRGRSCELAIHLLLEETHSAWREGSRVASGLALDAAGAFDNVNYIRLIHDLRKRQVLDDLIGWIESFLSNCRTSITLLEGNMGEFLVNTGIPQGSPLSLILFLFFNADLIKQILAECPDRKHQMVPKPSGRLDIPLIIKGVEIKPTDSIKYLGVYLDTHLTGEVHVQEMRKKAAKLVVGLSSIAGSTWGTPLVHLRKIYTAVLQPQIMYACSTWYIRGGRGFTGAQRAAEQAIRLIQDQALHQISGAFKRMLRQALEVCLHVPPAELTLAKLAEEACLRIMTSPLRSTLY